MASSLKRRLVAAAAALAIAGTSGLTFAQGREGQSPPAQPDLSATDAEARKGSVIAGMLLPFYITAASIAVTFSPTIWTAEQTKKTTRSGASKQQLEFVEANYDSIVRNVAQGQGEELSAFIGLLGCDGVVLDDPNTLAKRLQPDLDAIIPEERAPQMLLERLKWHIRRVDARYNKCKAMKL